MNICWCVCYNFRHITVWITIKFSDHTLRRTMNNYDSIMSSIVTMYVMVAEYWNFTVLGNLEEFHHRICLCRIKKSFQSSLVITKRPKLPLPIVVNQSLITVNLLSYWRYFHYMNGLHYINMMSEMNSWLIPTGFLLDCQNNTCGKKKVHTSASGQVTARTA